jgi:Trypsin
MKTFSVLFILGLLEITYAKIRTDCGLYFLNGKSWKILKIQFKACGESNIPAKGRIVNGKTTIPHAYPWLAAMYTQESFMCGGTIISDKNILTAGHCVF